MLFRRRSLALSLATTIPLLAACHDAATAPVTAPIPVAGLAPAAVCQMNVAERSMACTTAPAPSAARGGANLDRIIGGQDVYVRLTSTGTAYDAGTQILTSSVTVQNLTKSSIGTTDGATVMPVRVFFQQQPTVTGGTGAVTMANADGTDMFTSSSQPYYSYAQILAPYEISSPRVWQFSVPTTVTNFSFAVYVSAPMPDETASLLDIVWEGLADAAWLLACNWRDVVAPTIASTVVVPAAATLDPSASQPVLAAIDTVAHLRIGAGSTLGLGGYALTLTGNLDAIGTITSGTVELTGSNVHLGGNLDALRVTGGASLQRSTKATGAVSVTDGALSVSDHPLSIQIP